MKTAFKKILIAFDNSDASKLALQTACDFATRFESEITGLFVATNKNTDYQDSKNFLENFASAKRIPLKTEERKGTVYKEVTKMAKDGDFSLIILGADNKGGFMSGSSAFKVIASSTCPTITIRDTVSSISFDNILLPISDSRTTRQKVSYCVKIAKAFNSTVHIFGASKSSKDRAKKNVGAYLRQTERYLAEAGVKYTSDSAFGVKVPDACLAQAEKTNAGLVLIMTETESTGFFVASYAQQLVEKSQIPVMSVHSRDTRLVGASGY